MLTPTIRLGSVRGVDVRTDVSLLVALPVFAAALSFQFAGTHGYAHGWLVGPALAVAAIVLFFVCVLAHELAHAFEARHRGIHVAGVTLLFFGGTTAIGRSVRSPRDDFMVAFVGPFASFVASALFGIVAMSSLVLVRDGHLGLQPVADVAGFLAWTNAGLGVFNLLPGAPLDGGRIARAAMWRVSGSRVRAMRVAAHAGQVLGVLLLALAVFEATLELWVAAGASAVIAVFVFVTARRELRAADSYREVLSRPAGTFETERPSVPESSAIEDAAAQLDGRDAVLVIDGDGEIVGVLSGRRVADVPRDRRTTIGVRDLMTPLGDLPQVSAEDRLQDAEELLRDAPGVVVVRAGAVHDVLTPADLEAAVAGGPGVSAGTPGESTSGSGRSS